MNTKILNEVGNVLAQFSQCVCMSAYRILAGMNDDEKLFLPYERVL